MRTQADVLSAAHGRQERIVGDGTLANQNPGTALVGRALTPGVYYFPLRVAGNSSCEAHLKPAAGGVTGAVTARLYRTFRDRQTLKGAAVALAPSIAAGVVSSAKLSDLLGEGTAILEITVPALGALTLAEAEYNAL